MSNMWAPWRMEFIEDLRNKPDGCIFCKLQEQGDDRERLVLTRTPHAYVVMNKYPYNSGHLLIVPNSHKERLTDLSAEEQSELMRLMGNAVDILMEALNAEGANGGVNIGRAGGAGLTDHVHMHVVPRWSGDTNFMPIMSDTRSMPEYLEQTYDKLVGGFSKITQGDS